MPPQDLTHTVGESSKGRSSARSNGIIGRSSFALDRGDSEILGFDNDDNHSGCDDDDDDDDSPVMEEQQRRLLLLQHQQGEDPERLAAFEARRAPRHSQGRVLVSRRKSFLVQFSAMNGPPQIAGLMCLLAIGFGSTIGVVPAIMTDRFARLHHGYDGPLESCSDYGSNNAEKPEACFLGSSDAQAAAAMSNLVNNLLTFLTASVTGSLSDEYGRKGPLLLGLVLAMVPSLCLCVMLYTPALSPWWYYSTGAAGGLISWMSIALSALNDVLPPEFRAPGTGLLFAGFLLGISMSPTLSLLLPRTTLCFVSFGVICGGFAVTALWIPETLPPATAEHARRRRKAIALAENERDDQRAAEAAHSHRSVSSASLLSSLLSSPWSCLRRFYFGSCLCRTVRRFLTKPFREMAIVNRNSFFRLISVLALFTGMVQSGDQVLLLYYLEDQLGFDQKDVSLMFLVIGITGILVQVLVMKPLNDLVGEKMVVALSFLAGAVDNVLYGIARNKSTVFTALAISSLTTMSFPTISAIKANNVADTEQGRIQGALYSVKALAAGVGPAVLQFVYSRTKTNGWFGPGTMFVFAGGLFGVAVLLALALPNDKTNTSRRHGGSGISVAADRDDFSDGDESSSYEDRAAAGGPGIDDDDEQQPRDEYRRLASNPSSSEDDDDQYDEDTTYGSL